MSGLRHSSSLGFACEMKFSPETVLSLKRMEKEKMGRGEKRERREASDRLPEVQSQKD